MRLGAAGSENPVTRMDNATSVDISAVVLGTDRLAESRALVEHRLAVIELGIDGLGVQRRNDLAPR